VQHCTELYYTALPCSALHCPMLYYTMLYCTALHCTTLPTRHGILIASREGRFREAFAFLITTPSLLHPNSFASSYSLTPSLSSLLCLPSSSPIFSSLTPPLYFFLVFYLSPSPPSFTSLPPPPSIPLPLPSPLFLLLLQLLFPFLYLF
jgi:hypothetical protein